MPQDESSNTGWALTLSGGGLRATLFHLGVLRRLNESGDLSKVRAIFSVSGGSILAAHVRLNWERYSGSAEQFEGAAREIEAICKRDIRGRVVRRSLLCWLLLLPFWFRWIGKLPSLSWFARQARRMAPVDFLVREYESFYNQAWLPRSAPGVPVLHILATSLNTGTVAAFEDDRFRLRTPGFAPVPAQRTPIALGVAASSAYPALFGPVRIDADSLILFNGKFDGRHDLSDGGLYDNLGVVEACAVEAELKMEFERVIVSDAGAAITSATGPSPWSAIRRAIRTTDILMARMADGAMTKIANNKRFSFVSIHALVPRSSISENSQSSIGAVRTDLDVFTSRERAMIQRHGYEVTGLAVYGQSPDGAGEEQPPLADSQRSSVLGLFQWLDWTSWANVALIGFWSMLIFYSFAYTALRRDYHNHQVAEYLRIAGEGGTLVAVNAGLDNPSWETKVDKLAFTEYSDARSYSGLSLASQIPPLRWAMRLHNSAAVRLRVTQPFPPLNEPELDKSRQSVGAAKFEHDRQNAMLSYMHQIGDRWSREADEFTKMRDVLYLEVTRLAEKITESPSLSTKARNDFYTYYWGKLAVVESRAGAERYCSVETAMVHFGNWIDYWEKSATRPEQMDPVRDNLIRSLVREQESKPGAGPLGDDPSKCPVPRVPAR